MNDTVYIFKKSGSLVKIVSTTKIGKKLGYIVERIDTKKQMIVPKNSLVKFVKERHIHSWSIPGCFDAAGKFICKKES